MPPGTPFGPGIVSIAAYLHRCQMVTCSRLAELFDGLFGLKNAESAIANLLARTRNPVVGEADKIATIVPNSPVIASDETSARVCGKSWWQRLLVSTSAVNHTIVPTRGKVVPVEYSRRRPAQGVDIRKVSCPMQACRHAVRVLRHDAHQYSIAHLMRHDQYAIDAGDRVFEPGFNAPLKKACNIGRRRPDIADATIAKHARDLKRELDRLLDLEPTNSDGSHLRASMAVDAREKLAVFLTRGDVEPTNNVSERGLRPSAILRRMTNGFRTSWGAKVCAGLRTIVATGRLNGRSPLVSVRAFLAA